MFCDVMSGTERKPLKCYYEYSTGYNISLTTKKKEYNSSMTRLKSSSYETCNLLSNKLISMSLLRRQISGMTCCLVGASAAPTRQQDMTEISHYCLLYCSVEKKISVSIYSIYNIHLTADPGVASSNPSSAT